ICCRFYKGGIRGSNHATSWPERELQGLRGRVYTFDRIGGHRTRQRGLPLILDKINGWPAAVNVRESYWLYVVVDCATNPVLYRVQDPAFKLAVKSHQSFTVNIGDVIREAESD
ncbi:MAG: hypothetical protein KAU38_16305, partial [Desulfobacterales bacterium]|nr:hypothetical protein [Desulfobacterales bacterium]